MSLLTPPSPSSPSASLLIAQKVSLAKTAPRRAIEALYRNWVAGFDALWSTAPGATPALKLAALGTDAGELVALIEELGQFILDVLDSNNATITDDVTAKLTSIPAYTVAIDGTVTLD